jgi:hypothetical protein
MIESEAAMNEIRSKMVLLLEAWLNNPEQVDTLAFTFKRGRVDGNFLEVEIYFPDPDSDLKGDPEWAMVPVMKAMRPETQFNGEDWDIATMSESDISDFGKIFDKSGASN